MGQRKTVNITAAQAFRADPKGTIMRNHLFIGAAVAALVIPAAASAQQITSGIIGTVTDENGAPLAGAGIVADSDPHAELAETEAKILALRQAFSGD